MHVLGFLEFLGAIMQYLGDLTSSYVILEPCWGYLGTILGPFGAMLASVWLSAGSLRAHWERSGRAQTHSGAHWGVLGRFGAALERSGALLRVLGRSGQVSFTLLPACFRIAFSLLSACFQLAPSLLSACLKLPFNSLGGALGAV